MKNGPTHYLVNNLSMNNQCNTKNLDHTFTCGSIFIGILLLYKIDSKKNNYDIEFELSNIDITIC